QRALATRGGDCIAYHGLCAAVGRALGCPTRVTYGLHLFAKNSPSHCKLEAFLPPYGWVSFDVSEAQKLVAAVRRAGDLGAGRGGGRSWPGRPRSGCAAASATTPGCSARAAPTTSWRRRPPAAPLSCAPSTPRPTARPCPTPTRATRRTASSPG